MVKKASNAGGYIWREEKDVINNDGIYTIKNYKSQLHTKGKKVFIFTKDKVFVDKFESYAEALDSVQGKRYNIRIIIIGNPKNKLKSLMALFLLLKI